MSFHRFVSFKRSPRLILSMMTVTVRGREGQ